MLGVGYSVTFFQFILAILMTQQFRLDYVVAVEKLSVKRQFVRFVSHEIRTPLNSCALGLSYLRKMCVDTVAPPAAAAAPAGAPSADSLVTVIDEILDSCTMVGAPSLEAHCVQLCVTSHMSV